MKLFNKILVVFLIILPFGLSSQSLEGFSLHGASFSVKDNFNKAVQLKAISSNDSIPMQLKGEIVEVCQAKGCWMKVDLEDDTQVFVRFKNYGFFVPKDAATKTTILNGMAFIEEMSVEDQKHYAKDEGASDEEVTKITQTKKTYRFEADGVLIQDID